ncbi:MAG TPA: rhodanese-like domain-containing protein [Candidatus Eisenbacteria bacterium]|jgi:glyoxylase-like metal-dependent hydrolase (beta-lactamase superfamily II)/rhodanese-related sulfurtransferase
MYFKQFYVGCLAHASYLVGDGGEAAVVDPSRDIEMYLEDARANGLEIRWVLETHLHADFVSGHRDLAARTGATIAVGRKADAQYPHRALSDGDEIRLGGVVLRALETPGHTPESLSFLVFEHAGDEKPWGVLTGDTLFVGDVGRVDILSSRLPVTELAGLMYDSLHGKLLKLPDETRVWPAHGAGSLCGRSMSKDTWSTIGRERLMNPALRSMSRAEFVADITRDVPETPVYFLHSRDLNRAGPALRADTPLPPALAPREFAAAAREGAVILDTRSTAAFGVAHPAGALHVGLDGQYASWVGTLVNPGDRLLLVVEPARVEEALMRLARVGYENVVGTLDGGVERWKAEGLPLASIPQEPVDSALRPGRRVLDVRRPAEWERFHLKGATLIPLAQLPAKLGQLDRDADWVIVCASGYRSNIAASVLARAGFARLTNAAGGMDAYRGMGLPVEVGA